ncbi:unnamed protein product, partial [Vitis vinifera]
MASFILSLIITPELINETGPSHRSPHPSDHLALVVPRNLGPSQPSASQNLQFPLSDLLGPLALRWISLLEENATPFPFSMIKVTFCTDSFLSALVFCWKIVHMKSVADFSVCLLYSTPILSLNRMPPALFPALLVTKNSTAWTPCQVIVDRITREEISSICLAIGSSYLFSCLFLSKIEKGFPRIQHIKMQLARMPRPTVSSVWPLNKILY